MRPLALLTCLLVLGFAVAGCGGGGGNDTSAQTIQAPTLTVPGNETAPVVPNTTTTTPTTTVPNSGGVASGTPSGGTPSSSGGTGSGQTQTQSTTPSGGAQAPSSGTGGGSTTTPSSGGTAPGKFNQFCQENPGAC